MRKVYLLLIALAGLATSCMSELTYTEFQTRQAKPTVTTNVTPVAADLNVSSERIAFDVEYSTEKQSISISKAKEYAIADALKKYNADVLVAPLLKVTENNTSIHVTVYGYPATYKNFRKATVEECKAAQRTKTSKK